MAPRFLIVRFSAIGDCVMAVPTASVLRRAMPDCFIAWAVDSRCAPVIDTEELVDLRYEIPRQAWKKDHTTWFRQLRHFARLRRFQFDYGFDLQGHAKTALCLKFAGPKQGWAIRASDLAAFLLTPVAPISRRHKHHVERNLQMLGMVEQYEASIKPIMPRLETLPDLPDGVNYERLATISVSAGSPNKTYALAKWVEVAKTLQSQGYQVAFLGGEGDPEPRVEGSLNWVGKLSLAACMAAVAKSKVHLAADTGTGHMAAAYNVPVVSVFGFTNPASYRPYTNNGIVLNAGKTMDGIGPEQIVQAVNKLVAKQDAVLT